MAWIIIAGFALLVFGLSAWFYPQLKSRAAAARSAARFRALATELGVELSAGTAFSNAGFMPTVQSVFGPHGELRNGIVQDNDGETAYLFEYLFGARASGYRRSIAVIAVRLRKPVPMFTLVRPRHAARSRTTEIGARGQRLVVQAIGELELWSLKGERKRARSMVTPLIAELGDDCQWNIRGIDDWLLMFNEQAQDNLARFFETAMHLYKYLRK